MPRRSWATIGRAALGVTLLVPIALGIYATGQQRASPSNLLFAQEAPTSPVGPRPATAGVAFPLKASANGRYLVDQNNVPFMMVGDSPQALIGNVSISDAASYMKNRARYGINTLWINLICNDATACNQDGSTYDGITPFSVPGDLSTPNPAYFRRADAIIELAAEHGMLVLLDPIETSGWLSVLRANGIAKAREYGTFLGHRYGRYPNIIWMHGNDFATWHVMSDDALVHAVAAGIRSADHAHIHTIELGDYLTNASLNDSRWALSIGLDAAYTYLPTYAQVLAEYNRRNFLPVFMVEANYEFEHNAHTDGGSLQNLRRQAYWTMLSGATGQLYGSSYSWRFKADWQRNLDTPGIIELSYMKNLFADRRWYDLIPDQTHKTVVSGYGEFSRQGSVSTDTYVTAARTSNGTLMIAYLPTRRTITVDMTQLSGNVRAQWYDPTIGVYRGVSGSPFSNDGSRRFTPPGNNAAGDGDWVLVLEALSAPDTKAN
jgi:hypothetical protein